MDMWVGESIRGKRPSLLMLTRASRVLLCRVPDLSHSALWLRGWQLEDRGQIVRTTTMGHMGQTSAIIKNHSAIEIIPAAT